MGFLKTIFLQGSHGFFMKHGVSLYGKGSYRQMVKSMFGGHITNTEFYEVSVSTQIVLLNVTAIKRCYQSS